MEVTKNHTFQIPCRNTTVVIILPRQFSQVKTLINIRSNIYGKGKTQLEFQPGDLLTQLATTDSGDGISRKILNNERKTNEDKKQKDIKSIVISGIAV